MLVRSLLFLSLLFTCSACTGTKKTTETATENTETTAQADDHDHSPPITGLGSAIPNDFGAAMYAPSADVTAEQLMASLREAFPGKAIYLDLWATWCMPCIGEFPASKKLHADAEGLPVEFVYLCTSSKGTQARWESIVRSKKIPGTHVFVDRVVHSNIMASLKSNFYPFYAVLKPDGSFKRDVKRPSQLDRDRLARLID